MAAKIAFAWYFGHSLSDWTEKAPPVRDGAS
jgi:hypothetical protein